MRWLAVFVATFLIASPAFAHTGVGQTSGFLSGFVHPIGGLDHVLAMVAVGMFAYTLKGRALWLVPSSFVGMMAVGGVFGVLNVPIPFVELGIVLSVIVIGGLVAVGRSIPLAAAMATVGVFAVFHGHAHGAEMPATAAGIAYGVGFIAATAFLHATGLAAGFGLGRTSDAYGAGVSRLGGAAISVTGIALLSGVL